MKRQDIWLILGLTFMLFGFSFRFDPHGIEMLTDVYPKMAIFFGLLGLYCGLHWIWNSFIKQSEVDN